MRLSTLHCPASVDEVVRAGVELEQRLEEAVQRNETNLYLRARFVDAESSKRIAVIRAADAVESRDMINNSRQDERAIVRACRGVIVSRRRSGDRCRSRWLVGCA